MSMLWLVISDISHYTILYHWIITNLSILYMYQPYMRISSVWSVCGQCLLLPNKESPSILRVSRILMKWCNNTYTCTNTRTYAHTYQYIHVYRMCVCVSYWHWSARSLATKGQRLWYSREYYETASNWHNGHYCQYRAFIRWQRNREEAVERCVDEMRWVTESQYVRLDDENRQVFATGWESDLGKVRKM